MATGELKLGDVTYRVGKKLNAMEQFHCTRRLGPALVICGVTFQMMMDGADVGMDEWLNIAGPVMEVVSKMKDEDVEYVIYTCLRTVERSQGAAGWAPVMSPDGKQLMFADLDQAAMIRLTVEVLRGNLINFMKGIAVDGSLSDESAATPQP